MTNNIQDINKQIVDNLKSASNFSGYLDYINVLAPIFHPFLLDCIKSEKFAYEKDKHPDVEKYLYKPFETFSSNAGKLHRPLTCLAAYLACTNGDVSKVEQMFGIAASIENFQTAALIHDDIADDGQIRRGQACMHKNIGDGLAINAGDLGLSMTVGFVLRALQNSDFSSDKILKIIDKLLFMEYMTIEGQAMDLGWAKDNRFDILPQDYLTMATKKSAYYSAAVPCVLGAMCADADDKTIQALDNFAQKVGLAFQIQDDILNLCENEFSSDKDVYSDITEGKRTLCVCMAFKLSDEAQKNRLTQILKSGTKDLDTLKEAVQIIEQTGALKFAKTYASDLCAQAIQILEPALNDSG